MSSGVIIDGNRMLNKAGAPSIYPFVPIIRGVPPFAAFLPGNDYDGQEPGYDWTEGKRSLTFPAGNALEAYALGESNNLFASTSFTASQVAAGGACTILAVVNLPSSTTSPAPGLAKSVDDGQNFFGLVFTPANGRIVAQHRVAGTLQAPFVVAPAAIRGGWGMVGGVFSASGTYAFAQAPGGSLVTGTPITVGAASGPGVFRINDGGADPVGLTKMAAIIWYPLALTASEIASVRAALQAKIKKYGPTSGINILTAP